MVFSELEKGSARITACRVVAPVYIFSALQNKLPFALSSWGNVHWRYFLPPCRGSAGSNHVEVFIRGNGRAGCGEAGEQSWREEAMGVALAMYSEIDSVWIPSLEMNVEVRLEEDLAGIPPIGRKIPAKSKRWLGCILEKQFGTCVSLHY